ncbi:MAG: hypothetical protein IT284_02320 [Bacteroidetes bacterium]|nr:hypothetical protein [Bacteroidota bacterium]
MELDKYRLFATILMVISSLFWPFWITVGIFVFSIFLFKNFYAGIIIFFVMDIIYGFETVKIGPLYGILTISSVVSYFALYFIKKRIFFP